MSAETTRQADLVAFSNRLAERKSTLDEKERRLATESQRQLDEKLRIGDEWSELKSKEAQVKADQRVRAEWFRALEEARSARDVAMKTLAGCTTYAKGLEMKLDSYAACCVTERCIETFIGNRTSELSNMTNLDRRHFLVQQMGDDNRQDADSLDEKLDAFFKTRNSLCHQPGAVDKADHPSFQRKCDWIQRCLDDLEKQTNYKFC